MRTVTAATIAAICAILTLYSAIYTYELNHDAREKNVTLAAQVSELDKHLERLSFIPKLLSDDAHILDLVKQTTPLHTSQANKRLKKIQQESGLDFAFLMDINGDTIASSNWDEAVSFIGENYSFRPYFKASMRAQRATYFAIGATTGVPGYFIAEPVLIDAEVAGVVVAKTAITTPIETWQSLPHETAVLDEFGVIILSSEKSLLYQATRDLTAQEIKSIQAERRYEVASLSQNTTQDVLSRFITYQTPLSSEPWQFYTLVSKSSLYRMVLANTLIALIGLLTLWLLYRTYEQQHRLVTYEQQHSKELEEKVRIRSEELEQAQDALIAESNYAILGRMSAAITHEINQPLATLRLNMASLRKLIERPTENIHDIEQSVVESDRTTKRIGRVITSLRSYTRSNKMNLESVGVAQLIAEAASVINTERPTLSTHLSVQSLDSNTTLFADIVLLQQALLNLLYNAMDAVIGVPQPQLSLSASKPLKPSDLTAHFADTHNLKALNRLNTNNEYILISVEDNGAGVPDHIINTLFEPFTTDKPNHRGLGLGLTIANQIAEGHNGLLLYSRDNSTSSFSLVLPLI